MATYFTPWGIYTPFGMTPIKREIPPFIVTDEMMRTKSLSRILDNEPERFQRLIHIHIDPPSKYNQNAGNLPL